MTDESAPGRYERLWLASLSGILGALPDHVGQFRLASTYLRRRKPARRILVQRMRDGTQLALDISDRAQGIAYLTRRYEPELVDYIVRRLPADGVFVDAGAHVGLVSLAVARRRPHARVIAFEPNESNARAWYVNRYLNASDNAELEQAALADRPGRQRFRNDDDSAAGSLSADGDATVDVTTLDDYASQNHIAHVDVLKIDTEGGEKAVIDGASALLSRGAVSTIVCEFNAVHLERLPHSAADIAQGIIGAGFREVSLPPPRSRLRPSSRTASHIVDAAFERVAADR